MLEKAIDTMYGRVSVYIPKHKPRKMKNAVFIVSYWLPSWNPNYVSMNSWLSYEVEETFYEIFNPQKHKFNYNQLLVYIVAHHKKCGAKIPRHFRIMRRSDFKKWGT